MNRHEYAKKSISYCLSLANKQIKNEWFFVAQHTPYHTSCEYYTVRHTCIKHDKMRYTVNMTYGTMYNSLCDKRFNILYSILYVVYMLWCITLYVFHYTIQHTIYYAEYHAIQSIVRHNI